MKDPLDRRHFLVTSAGVALAGASLAQAADAKDREKQSRRRLSLYLASTFNCKGCGPHLAQIGKNEIDGFSSVNDAGNALENVLRGVWESDPSRVVKVLRGFDGAMLSGCERELVAALWAVAELIVAARGQCVVFTKELAVVNVVLDQKRLDSGVAWISRWVSSLKLDAMMKQIVGQIKSGLPVCGKNYNPQLTFEAYGPAYLSAAKLVDVFDLLGAELSRLLLLFATDVDYKCLVRSFSDLFSEAVAKHVGPARSGFDRKVVSKLWNEELGPTIKEITFRVANDLLPTGR